MDVETRIQACAKCGRNRQVGERILVGYWGVTRSWSLKGWHEEWATVSRVDTQYLDGTGRTHVREMTFDNGDTTHGLAAYNLQGCVCADRESRGFIPPTRASRRRRVKYEHEQMELL